MVRPAMQSIVRRRPLWLAPHHEVSRCVQSSDDIVTR